LIKPTLRRSIGLDEFEKPGIRHALGGLSPRCRTDGFLAGTTDGGGHAEIIGRRYRAVKQKRGGFRE
jgi:hypothetical protein